MRRLLRVLLIIVAVLVALALIALGVRFVNQARFPEPGRAYPDPKNAAAYPTTVEGLTVTALPGTAASGTALRGFHLAPAQRKHPGTVFVWGGSDGGCDFERASALAQAGHDVYALFFFGQPGQPQALQRVPLEFFGTALAHARQQGADTSTVTVLGSSKGAELALLLPTYYPEISNVVAFAPTEYVWQGLNYSSPGSTWTWQGADVPYVSFAQADQGANRDMMLAMLLGTPAKLRPVYASAAAAGVPNGARIDPTKIKGHLLLFSGEQDEMWMSSEAADHLALARPATENVVYPDAGHILGLNGSWAGGFALGGTADANVEAGADSMNILREHLAAWTA